MRDLARLFAVIALGAITMAGCSSSSSSSSTTADTPNYASVGPNVVGVTTLDLGSAGSLGERMATVFYPGNNADLSGSVAYHHFSYTAADTIPASLRSILPAKFDTTTMTSAWADLPASKAGPYPVVLFSHGFGGERLQYSKILTGIASWGYVVVSADYLERGLAAQALGVKGVWTPARDTTTMTESLAATLTASGTSSSVLHGVANPKLLATAGHSQGGQTAFDALANPNVKTAIGWAPVGPTGTPSMKPVMLIGAEGDIVVKPSRVRTTYESFRGPRSLIEISGEGHNTYTDICTSIRSGGGGLIGYAVANHLVKPALVPAALNGCQEQDLVATRFWPIVQYYTVFQLKAHLGNGPTSVPTPASGAFPGFTVTVTQAG